MGEPRDQSEHYFVAEPAVASRRSSVRLDLPDRSFTLATDHGVFGRERVDPGTKFLLLEAPSPPTTGTFVDLGCGYGPIACTLAARAPDATVWAVDTNRRALALCQENAEAAGLTNVHPAEPDGVPDDLQIDLLWSNPPIRIGKGPLHRLLTSWLARLTHGGQAVLVVQRHLGADSLQRWLNESGHPTERLGSRAGYRLLEVRTS